MLSSDSELSPVNSFIKEDYGHHEELSELTTSHFQGRGKDENAGGKSKSRKISDKKLSKKQVKSEVCTSPEEKIVISDTNKERLTLEGERVVR